MADGRSIGITAKLQNGQENWFSLRGVVKATVNDPKQLLGIKGASETSSIWKPYTVNETHYVDSLVWVLYVVPQQVETLNGHSAMF